MADWDTASDILSDLPSHFEHLADKAFESDIRIRQTEQAVPRPAGHRDPGAPVRRGGQPAQGRASVPAVRGRAQPAMNLEERGAEIAADIERVEAELAGEEAEAAVSLQIERAAVGGGS